MERIEQILDELELKHNILIIYAVESGSRAWGMASKDSDFDIRFIYVHRSPTSYLSLNPTAFPKTIDGFSEDRLYDWQGWELSKALGHLRDTNPSIVEWLYSPIIYRTTSDPMDLAGWSKALLEGERRTAALMQHYHSMAKKNYLSHIDGKSQVNVKKYMYVIRPVAMLEWLLKVNNPTGPLIQIDCTALFGDIKEFIGDELYASIMDLNRRKQNMQEGDLQERISSVDEWIHKAISNEMSELIKAKFTGQPEKVPYEDFDIVFHKFLKIK